jgi:arginine deiminase
MSTTNLFVNSEIGTLQRVIIHRPDEGISRISPKRAEELLFDDVAYLPSNELSRARGGSHCMTCPIQRAEI